MTSAIDSPPAQLVAGRPLREVLRGIPLGFLAAAQFLTIVPPLVRRPFTPTELGRAVGWFTLVGILLGSTLAGIDLALGLVFPPLVVAALILAIWALATGALHLDGFLDSCDGLWGGQTPEARLRIMRDERAGAFAVIGGVLLLLVKYACLASLTHRTIALVLAAALGRWGMALAVVAFPYARTAGLGRVMKDHAGWRQMILANFTALAAAWLVAERWGMTAVASAALTTAAVAALVLRRLPGFTGDTYGAVCELVETAILLVFVGGEMP